CTGGQGPPVSSARPTQPTAPGGSVGAQGRLEFSGSPAPAGRRCPTPSREAGAYTILVTPTSGSVGSKVILSENTPLFNEAGRYLGPSGKIGFWFVNLPFNDSEIGYTAKGPTTAEGAQLVHLGETSVVGQCSYRVAFSVPDVVPGTYGVV